MRITVKFFAILRERAGVSAIDLELPDASDASAAIGLLVARHASLIGFIEKSAVAINRVYAPRDSLLCDGDELALIPPVSGG